MNTAPSRRRDVTVADVARAAKVSKAQTARALGNYGAVSEEVRLRVLAAAEALEYYPNELARSMNTGRSHTIGVVMGDIENPHFSLAMRGISNVAKARGFDVILVNTGEDQAAEIDAVKVLLDKRVDGLIVAPASCRETQHLHRIHKSGRPVILLDRKVHGLETDMIAVDMTEISYQATTELLSAGHRRIAFISTGRPTESSQIAERVEGMRRAFDEADVVFCEDLVRFDAGSPTQIMAAVGEILNSPHAATAIVASDGLVGLSVVEAIQAKNLHIPADVSFLMYDDSPWARVTCPPLTVIAQPVYEMGAAAATALIDRIKGTTPKRTVSTFTADLIRRGSVAAPVSRQA
ncbi:LacI family DNA-binding transcriptional regulator [Arthrobacter sp. K5]|uniref:LacI family DNA-binding transcriptional regulator n=1 Tax=Arthrobacter sp. K5 TaxID=2839623 RepID=A0AAU8EYR1_9MICC